MSAALRKAGSSLSPAKLVAAFIAKFDPANAKIIRASSDCNRPGAAGGGCADARRRGAGADAAAEIRPGSRHHQIDLGETAPAPQIDCVAQRFAAACSSR